MAAKPTLGIGLIGTGFMGRCHAIAYRSAETLLGLPLSLSLVGIADVNREAADRFAADFGFGYTTGDWRALLDDPAVELVAITAPNALHKEMAIAALEAGRHVYCEKPMALSAADAREMAETAARAGRVTQLGYNYLPNPAIQLTAKLVREGALGRIHAFRCVNDEDYMADATVPFSWRTERATSGSGTLGDLGGHAISIAHFLMGPIDAVSAISQTVVEERPDPGTATMSRSAAGGQSGAARDPGSWPRRRVENEDQALALLRFRSGAVGSFASSRVAWGWKNRLAFEINGTEGTILFDQERFNEIQLYQPGKETTNGFRTVRIGPDHPPFAAFLPARGHQLGFNDLKTLEVGNLVRAIAEERDGYPAFVDGVAIEAVLEAMERSAATGSLETVAA